MIAGIILGGHYLMRPVFRFIANRVYEISSPRRYCWSFDSTSHRIGRFIAGAWHLLAGVVLAESEYRHELEANIEPFKGLLLGLFLSRSVLASTSRLLAEHPFLIAGLPLLLLTVKFLILQGVGGLAHMAHGHRWSFSFALAQGSEFVFVLFSLPIN